MSDVQQMQDDLRFVRNAVTRRERQAHGPAAIYWVWAIYVLIGYTMLDESPRIASWFFLIGGFAGGGISAWLGKRAAAVRGESDKITGRRTMLHFMVGCLMAIACSIALCIVLPLSGMAGGQLIVVMIGLVYFLAGIHLDRNFLWLGPILMVGGIVIGKVPNHHNWTCLGIVIAIGLVVPTFFRKDSARGQAAPVAT